MEKVKSYWWKGSTKYSYKDQPIVFSDQCISINKTEYTITPDTYYNIRFSIVGKDQYIFWGFHDKLQERDDVFEQLKNM